MLKHVMGEMEKQWRLCPRADAQMYEEKLGILRSVHNRTASQPRPG